MNPKFRLGTAPLTKNAIEVIRRAPVRKSVVVLKQREEAEKVKDNGSDEELVGNVKVFSFDELNALDDNRDQHEAADEQCDDVHRKHG